MEQCCAWAARYPHQVPAHQRRVRVHRRLHARGLRMTTPDVRAFYAALGIELPAWSTRDAPVRCFAQPDAHQHADRSPSCSVNLASGAWNCHGCGAHGGAYDAALATGHSPRSAMELLIAHGLAEPRAPSAGRRTATPHTAAGHAREAVASTAAITPLAADEDDIRVLGGDARRRRPPDPPARAGAGMGDPGASASCRSVSTAPGSRSRSETRTARFEASAATTRSGRASRRCSPSRAHASD